MTDALPVTTCPVTALDHTSAAVAHAIQAVQALAYAQEAALLGVQHFPPLYERAAEIRAADARFWGVWAGRALAGCVRLEREGDGWLIGSLTVHPDYQRRGLGRRLVEHALTEAAGAAVWVSTGARNAPALTLYAALGFVEVARHTAGTVEPVEVVRLQRPRA